MTHVTDDPHVMNMDLMYDTMIHVIMTVEIVNLGIMMHGTHVTQDMIRDMIQEIAHQRGNDLMIMIM